MKHHVIRSLAQAKRLVGLLIGFTVLAAGGAMIALPGPAINRIGLALLATEFIWSGKLPDHVKDRNRRMR